MNKGEDITSYYHTWLDRAQHYANNMSTCAKVKVGSVIKTRSFVTNTVYGCNHGINNCTQNGCRRIMLYGNASKEHRLPSDCDALHSEVDAIAKAARIGLSTAGAEIYVTRYPCEACARAIVAAGITTVIYGRKEPISEYTAQIFERADVNVVHVESWEEEDNNE